MKGFVWFIAGALLATFLVRSARAHLGDRIYPIYEITDEMLMEIDVRDGSVEDWEEIVGEPSVTAANLSSLPTGGRSEPVEMYDPGDLDFRIWLGWNQSRHLIFFGFVGADNRYVNEYEGTVSITSEHDSIIFMVDGDHSGGRLYNDSSWTPEERDLNFNRTHQYYNAIAATPESRHIEYPRPAFDWILSPPYADSGGRVTGEGPAISVIEFFITSFDELVWSSPEESALSALFPGRIVGFDIVVYDHDARPGEYHGVFSLSGEFSLGMFADQFVDGILIGAGTGVPGDTALESGTWGRIKASFRE